jgi:hypothetical protein
MQSPQIKGETISGLSVANDTILVDTATIKCTIMNEYHFPEDMHILPIAVAARSKARTVFARSNTEIADSNPIRGMDVCVLCAFILCLPRVEACKNASTLIPASRKR